MGRLSRGRDGGRVVSQQVDGSLREDWETRECFREVAHGKKVMVRKWARLRPDSAVSECQ